MSGELSYCSEMGNSNKKLKKIIQLQQELEIVKLT